MKARDRLKELIFQPIHYVRVEPELAPAVYDLPAFFQLFEQGFCFCLGESALQCELGEIESREASACDSDLDTLFWVRLEQDPEVFQ